MAARDNVEEKVDVLVKKVDEPGPCSTTESMRPISGSTRYSDYLKPILDATPDGVGREQKRTPLVAHRWRNRLCNERPIAGESTRRSTRPRRSRARPYMSAFQW